MVAEQDLQGRIILLLEKNLLGASATGIVRSYVFWDFELTNPVFTLIYSSGSVVEIACNQKIEAINVQQLFIS